MRKSRQAMPCLESATWVMLRCRVRKPKAPKSKAIVPKITTITVLEGDEASTTTPTASPEAARR